MSLQRVFESARKMGVPVIVTDPAGRDPMVVLPLEQFEAMAGEEKLEIPDHGMDSRLRGNDDTIKNFEIPLNQAKNVPDELPIEDRFYLEPTDDEAGV